MGMVRSGVPERESTGSAKTTQEQPGGIDTALVPSIAAREDDSPASLLHLTVDGNLGCFPVEEAASIGRDPETDICLDDSASSRAHIRVTPMGEGTLLVADLGSRNGTYVNGRPHKEGICQPGDLIRVGNSFLIVRSSREEWFPSTSEGPLVGGASLASLRRTMDLVAETELSVLVRGETGTGKEVVARELHRRSKQPGEFVAVNCAALPPALAEVQLFGSPQGEDGGLLELADNGTLFLDEIADLHSEAQAMLLRVVEDGLVRRRGNREARQLRLRLVCATNKDLHDAVERGEFRRDLHARLCGAELHLPALRARREDIPALVRFLNERAGRASLAIQPDAMEALLLHDWKSNVRELDNLVRMLSLEGKAVDLDNLPAAMQTSLRQARRGEYPPSRTLPGALPANEEDPFPTQATDRASVARALTMHRGNVRRAADAIGVARSHMYRLLKRYGLDPESFRG